MFDRFSHTNCLLFKPISMQTPGEPASSHPWKCFVRAMNIICSRQRFIALLGSTEPPQKNLTETTAIYILWKEYCWFCGVLDYAGLWLWEGHYKFLSCVKTKDDTWQCLLQSPNCSYHALVLLDTHCLHRAWAGLYWMHKTLLDIDGLHRPCTGNWQYHWGCENVQCQLDPWPCWPS